jgi:hypothetical protein
MGPNEWWESDSRADYRVILEGGEYKVYCLNKLIGGGITLEQAKEVIEEDIDFEEQREW